MTWEISKIGNDYDQWMIFDGDKLIANSVNGGANARLVAAAPELLAALQGIMAGVAGCQKDEKYQAARAAIDKATGEPT